MFQRYIFNYLHFNQTINKTRTTTLGNRCKLYPPERKLTKANQPSLNLEGGAQGEGGVGVAKVNSDHIKIFSAHDFL